MAAKTYLTTEQQWDKTVELFRSTDPEFIDNYELGEKGLAEKWLIGIIAKPHRLIKLENGDGWRANVYATSSKGYRIIRLWLPYTKEGINYRKAGYTSYTDASTAKPGAVKLVEHPDELTGKPPTDPAVRRFVVDHLRASGRTPGKHE
jgi:hypothetical protein